MKKRKRLGDRLIEAGLLTNNQLKISLKNQKRTGLKLGEQIIEEGFLTELQIFSFLQKQLGIPHINLQSYVINSDAVKEVGENYARQNKIIPIDFKNGYLLLVMVDPMDLVVIDDVSIMTGMKIKPAIASKASIIAAIDSIYNKELDEIKSKEESTEHEALGAIEENEEVSNSPMVRLVNKIISDGIKSGASDIHIEPNQDNVRIRFRIDGDLRRYVITKKENHAPLTTRIKIMGKMDISEKRKPQDGRIETVINSHLVDMRISVLPTVYGEKIVIRLLDRSSVVTDKSKLGFSKRNLKIIEKIMQIPQGIILATGPTGSGKTTTLYSMLKELNTVDKNLITVEDPVEYRLKGINQVQVNKKAGLTFASGLRSILRQDPDVVMVGEIRDEETASIAIRASITGHVVLSTLHTNDTASTITRLIDMKVKPYVLSSALIGVISQRLVKRLCNNCKEEFITDRADMELLKLKKPEKIYRAKGCSACNDVGYSGRTAIHEIMVINKEVKKKINDDCSAAVIKDAAVESGMQLLEESCREVVLRGETTIEELVKASYTMD